MNALFAGRLCDIVRHVEAGQLETARNLVVNTPGVDWTHWLSPATYAALFGWSPPAACRSATWSARPASVILCRRRVICRHTDRPTDPQRLGWIEEGVR